MDRICSYLIQMNLIDGHWEGQVHVNCISKYFEILRKDNYFCFFFKQKLKKKKTEIILES